jgi:hypothetical protein
MALYLELERPIWLQLQRPLKSTMKFAMFPLGKRVGACASSAAPTSTVTITHKRVIGLFGVVLTGHCKPHEDRLGSLMRLSYNA